jgi:hypothetical protein
MTRMMRRTFCHCHPAASTFNHEEQPCGRSTDCIHSFVEELELHQQVRLELLKELGNVRRMNEGAERHAEV